MKYLTILLVCLFSLGGGILYKLSKKETADAAHTLTFLVSPDYPPFEFERDGVIMGFDIDLITEISQRLGKTAKSMLMSFDGILGSLQSHRAHLAISALSDTPARRRSVDFSKPYHVSSSVIVCLDERHKTFEDFKPYVLGVQLGSTYHEYAKNLENQQIVSLEKVPELIQSLLSKRIAGIMMGVHEAEKIKASFNIPVFIIPIPDTSVSYSIAFPKNDPLRDQVDKVLEDLEKEGVLEQLSAKWFSEVSKSNDPVTTPVVHSQTVPLTS